MKSSLYLQIKVNFMKMCLINSFHFLYFLYSIINSDCLSDQNQFYDWNLGCSTIKVVNFKLKLNIYRNLGINHGSLIQMKSDVYFFILNFSIW